MIYRGYIIPLLALLLLAAGILAGCVGPVEGLTCSPKTDLPSVNIVTEPVFAEGIAV